MLRRRDPSGLAEFLDSDGNLIADDGSSDGIKYFTTLEVVQNSTVNGVIDFERAIADEHTTEVPCKEVIRDMEQAVDDAGFGRREEGGLIYRDSDGSMGVHRAKTGADPLKPDGTIVNASINLQDLRNPEDVRLSHEPGGNFHTHPRATVPGENNTEYFWHPEPSPTDISNAQEYPNEKRYVLAPLNGTVYIYSSSGIHQAINMPVFFTIWK